MAYSSTQMPSLSFSGLKELRKRLFFAFIALVVYRIGAHIQVPGVNAELLNLLSSQNNNGIMAHFNLISGGSLSRFTIFSLGLTPYIFVSILVQILSKVVPSLEQLQKEGEAGRRQLNQYTRYGTVLFAIPSSFSLTQWLISTGVVVEPSIMFYAVAMITLIAGSTFLMWLGEQITERGIGNGVSLIIFAGIVSGLPRSIIQLIEQIRQGEIGLLTLLVITLIAVTMTGFVVFMEQAQRKITINYPKRQQGRHMYAASSSYLPLKINMSGIMPTIFASNITIIPGMLLSMLLTRLGIMEKYPILKEVGKRFNPGEPVYMVTLALAIIFFCFFYTALMSSPRDMADNLKKSGAFIPGIRPGDHSARYIDKILTRLTVIGCLYLVSVVLLPDLMVVGFKIPFGFGGTSLLIVLVVIMEMMSQIQSLLMSHQYEPLLKKAGLKRNITI